MSGKRVVHEDYGPGEIVLYTYLEDKPAVQIRFDKLVDEVVVAENDPRLREQKEENNLARNDDITSGIREYDDVANMDSETLVKGLVDVLIKGVNPDYVKVVWMRKEIMRRIARGEHL